MTRSEYAANEYLAACKRLDWTAASVTQRLHQRKPRSWFARLFNI